MKKLKIFAPICCLFLFELVMFAQDQPPKILVMGVPKYLFKNGIRIDIDIASKVYKSSWVLSPQYYIDVSELVNRNTKKYKQLHGYGLSIHRKGFLSHSKIEKGVYISGGIGFQHFNILANAERWIEIDDDELKYLQLVKDDYHMFINKVLTEALIGYQKEIFSRMYIDIYVGIGLRYSFYDQPSGLDLKFNRNIIDYGYTGTAFVGGIRFGVGF